jgi:hypothetical protein
VQFGVQQYSSDHNQHMLSTLALNYEYSLAALVHCNDTNKAVGLLRQNCCCAAQGSA